MRAGGTLPNRPWHLSLVSGSHFDLGWCMDPAQSLAYADLIIKTVVDAIAGEHPDYRFTVEYAFFMKHFLERYPEYLETVRRLVAEGKLEVCATAMGAMEQILDGELLVRELVEGKRWVRETLGADPLTAQHSDLPGHTAQMPQILAKAGIRYMAGSRFHPPKLVFWRIAPDGSKVLFAAQVHHYSWGFVLRHGVEHAQERLKEQVAELEGVWPKPQVLMAEEHDLMLPDFGVLEVARDLNTRQKDYQIKPATITQFFEALDKDGLPEYGGESPYGFWSLPAMEARIYQEARAAENRLAAAEKLSSFRELTGRGTYPAGEIRELWRKLFYPQDHNIGGRHGGENEEVRLHKAIEARIGAEELVREAVLSNAVRIAYSQPDAVPVVVHNPCSWRRRDIVEASAEFHDLGVKGIRLTNAQGREIPAQVFWKDAAARDRYDFANSTRVRLDFAFVADVPPVGYRTYYAAPCRAESEMISSARDLQSAVESKFGNRYFDIELDGRGIASLLWKRGDRRIARAEEFGFGEVIALEDLRGDLEDAIEEQREKQVVSDVSHHELVEKTQLTGRSWRVDPSKANVEIVERGPVQVRMRVSNVLMDSPVVQEITLFEELERVDVKVIIDWQDRLNTMVVVRFPFAFERPTITYETPFWAVRLEDDEMENTYRGCGGRQAQKWIDVAAGGWGVTMATGCCAHILSGNTVDAAILKTSYSTGDAFHIYRNPGRHEFSFRLVPHEGRWQDAVSFRAGWEKNNPLIPGHFHDPIVPAPSFAGAPEEDSLLSVEPDNVVVTTVKRADSGTGWVVRLFEAGGVDCRARVTFFRPIRGAHKANLLEEPESGELAVDGSAIFEVRKHEIVTLLVDV